tara:strand:- start:139 stop:480 length:342 start_codon:yes stop_codon:yes gene_type:complete
LIEQIAFGELGMNVNDLYDMTPRNFINAQLGSKKLYDQNQQAEWERARWMSCVIINPHLKRSIDPKKITTFPWEVTPKTSSNIKKDIDKIMKESAFDDKIQEKINKEKKKKNA